MSDDFGDEKFKDFMDRQNSSPDPLEIIVRTIHLKMKSLIEIYSRTLETYITLSESDPLKTTLQNTLEKITEHIMQTLNQYDYSLIEDNEEDTSNDDEEPPVV